MDDKQPTLKRASSSPAKELLSVVIPLFNERDNIRALIEELENVGQQLSSIDIEYLLVDDGSTDDTFAIAKEIASLRSDAKVIRFARNYGHHAAIAAGLAQAAGDCAVFIAGDLQDPPSVIPEMLSQWRAGFKIVFAARKYVEKQPFWEWFFSRCFWLVFNLGTEHKLPAAGVDFALLDRTVVDIIKRQAHARIPTFTHIVETGFPYAIVKYVKRPRASGTSGWTLPKKFAYAFHTIYNSMQLFRMFSVAIALLCLFSASVFLLAVRRLHLDWALAVDVIGLHLVLLGLLVLVLLLAEHLNLRLKSIEGTPRFVVLETACEDGEN
jgi:dolichol-phosphate mannosyltransferase